jgi:hypothetical protein
MARAAGQAPPRALHKNGRIRVAIDNDNLPGEDARHVQLAEGAKVANQSEADTPPENQEVQTYDKGWYEDPNDPTMLRFWDGERWTDQRRDRETQAADRPVTRTTWVRFPGASWFWFWALLITATLGILWGAAEQHDQGCYNKVLAQVASGNTEQTNCLLLPWNDPAE